MKIKRLFWILFLLNLFNYIDRQVLYAVFPLLQHDLALSDLQLGTLASAFMLVYMCYAPVVGYCADRMSRPWLIAFSAFIWSGATLACAGAKNYISLLLPRTLIGVGEGGFTTIAQPFLAEHYPKEKHAPLLAAFGLALPLGSALGYIIGAVAGSHWGWRVAFMIVGVPGMVLALLAGTILKDKARTVKNTSTPTLVDYWPLLKNKPFLYICLAQAMSTFLMGGLAAWMPTYLHRFAGLTIAQAGTYFGGLVIICGFLGTYLGGKLAAWWLARSNHAYGQLITWSFLLAVPLCWGAVCTPATWILFVCLALILILLFIPTGSIAAALVATTPGPVRSMAFALNIFLIHLLGDAISPAIIGQISDLWSLKVAVLIASLALLPGAWAAWKAHT